MDALFLAQADGDGNVGGWVLGIVLILVALAALLFFIAAVVSIIRSTNYASGGKAIWILAVLAFPFIGSLFWFVWGRNSTFQNPTPSPR
ncbi:hypothetical protein BAY61_11555 [Prauserella marina]|uniref:Phospholipase_D-nuclease N-terminal n=1 Tax=Prauserella marina TaxID=530584 RepID=A0A222VNM0_9PSEU|nr:PLD nuclease N-terminal domain-containing protein [Prauserella marina]ASR35526.1 hypothetical protein BAY61_11555 [Prauserella marina]PWV84637.1 phospholipase D-like protein [Prauserella marina]SDC17025.1 Phospholipase_D-nuclease N-terminal [Prauserella marina]